MSENPESLGTLYLVATPIGHLGDVSERLREVLSNAGAIAAEDTRRTLKLLSALGIGRPRLYFSCHDHNESQAAARVVGLLRDGVDVALCTDAGSPLVSDPGYEVVRQALAHDMPITAIPGPSAALAALAVAGLPPSSFTVLGFLPRRPGRMRRELLRELRSPHTLILFESPHRLARLLQIAFEALGDRQAAVCVDLTKRFERVHRGPLSALAALAQTLDRRGEVTVVIAGVPRRRDTDDEVDDEELPEDEAPADDEEPPEEEPPEDEPQP